jgi:hypothetical protein
MHAFPLSMGMSQEDAHSTEYMEVTTAGLAERCAEAAASWGTDKVASPLDPSVLYKDPEAHPLALTLMALDRYGPSIMDWDPEVLRATMLRDHMQVSGAAWTKLLAARVLLASPSPWRQWEAFHWVARGLAGLPPNFTYLEMPELGHLAAAADMMKICDPKRQTSPEVDRYVAATLQHEGFCWAPDPLSFAQRALEQPQLDCSKCGALFPDDHDVRCVSCGAPGLKSVPYPHAAVRDQCDQLWVSRKSLPLERAVDGLPHDGAGNLVHDWALQWAYTERVRSSLLAQLRGLAR